MPPIFNFIGKIFKPAAELVDDVVTSKEEKLLLRNELARIQQEVTSQMLNYEQQLMQNRSSVIQGEVSGTWLQRSWRPLLMLSFGFIIIYQYFISPVLGLTLVNLPSGFWTLLEIGVGGYVVGRSLEKVTPNISDAIIAKKTEASDNQTASQSFPTLPQHKGIHINHPTLQQLPNGITNGHFNSDENMLKVNKREARKLARRRRGEERRRRRAQMSVQ